MTVAKLATSAWGQATLSALEKSKMNLITALSDRKNKVTGYS